MVISPHNEKKTLISVPLLARPPMSLTFAVLHALCSVSGSPTAYRLGFGSPTRLVRFGFVGETASLASISLDDASSFREDGTLMRCWGSSTTVVSVFFRLRLGGSTAFGSPESV